MTNWTTPETREFAERLLADEAVAATLSQASVPVAFRVCEELRPSLTKLAGAAGFHSLLLRALTLAKRQAPGLSAVRVDADGSLKDDDAGPNLDNYDAEEGVLLVAHLIGLLFTFIGESLTLRLMHDVWPNASFVSSTAERTGKHEPRG
jgi:hypothetical protein